MLLKISELLDESRVRVPLEATAPDAIIEELVDLFPDCRNRQLREEIVRLVLEREALETTGIGHGVAFPHAMAPVGSRVLIALGITREPVDFEAFDRHPVRIVFLIVGAEENRTMQLRVLSRASTLLHEADFRKALLAAPDAATVLQLIRDAEAAP